MVCGGSEIGGVVVLCDEREMGSEGGWKVEREDEVKIERSEKWEEWLGIWEEKGKSERIDKRMGGLL